MTTAPPPGDDQRPLQPAGADGAPGAAEAADGRNTGAIVALVFGLVGTVCALLGAGLLGAIAGVTAIVLGAEGRRKVDAGRTTRNRGVATAGLVTGIIAAVLGVLMMLLAAAEISTTLQDGP